MPTNTFTTLIAAKTLRQRHPDAPPSVVLVALVLALFADGKTGASIRPGFERVAEITGLSRSSVTRAIRWLEARGEIRRDKEARRGSAAFFTWIGGMENGSPLGDPTGEESGVTMNPHTSNGVSPGRNGVSPGTPHLPDLPDPPGLPVPSGRHGAGSQEDHTAPRVCAKHNAPLEMGICWTCKDEKFEREQQSDAQAKTRRINIRESTERYV